MIHAASIGIWHSAQYMCSIGVWDLYLCHSNLVRSRYWNELAVPSQIADTTLLFQPWVAPHTLLILVKFMERAVYANRTGANLDAELSTAITRAAIQFNHSLMDAVFKRLWEDIRVVQPTDPACISPPHGNQGCATDGIQIDSSFHQVQKSSEGGNGDGASRGIEKEAGGADRERQRVCVCVCVCVCV